MQSNPIPLAQSMTLFMCGDVMTGRAIDQILPYPSSPTIHETYLKDARDYIKLAETAYGSIPRPVTFSYIWGDALAELERVAPNLRLINLETSITTSDNYWKSKRIHYRMQPQNIPCLSAAKIDYCSLANNHTLDWGYAGLNETLETLKQARIQFAGAGRNLAEAAAPAVMNVPGKGRVIVFSFGSTDSGIPLSWEAGEDRPGINLRDRSDRSVDDVKQQVRDLEQPGDIFVASIHWGGNWGYEILPEQREFAHKLIDEAGIDLIHGHSAHHFKGIEVYRDRPIIYGCGDFIDDYEGIGGYEVYREDLAMMYFVRCDLATGQLIQLRTMPLQIRHFRVNRVTKEDALFVRDLLNREGKPLGTRIELKPDGSLRLEWS